LYEKGTLYGDREPRGGAPVSRAELDAAVARLGAAGAEGTLLDALDRLALPPAVREAIVARIEVSTAFPASDQAATVLAEGAAGFGAFPSHGVAGGNQRIADELARRLGDRVRLGSPVERISWTERSVRAGNVGADACVVAVPASASGRIAFEPQLPAAKAAALDAVRYGQAAKLFLPLAGPAGPSATLSVPGRFWVWTQRAPDGSPLPVAAAFGGTAAAVELLRSAGARHVRELRPDLVYAEGEPLLSTWDDDPWAGGAYSARSLASPLDDTALAAPVGPLVFAGEHTAGPWHGLMEGALRSGLRAAGQLLDSGPWPTG
jgi:monoamine oxidase